MRLKSLSFEDKRTGWKVENLRLDRFNLLVGASGVGKTRILRAIRTVQATASRGDYEPYSERGIHFDVHFEQEEQDYRWQFHSVAADLASGERDVRAAPWAVDVSPVVLSERLHMTGEGLLIEREQERFLFKKKELPMLDRTASALQLLDEPSIARLRQAFEELLLGTLGPQDIQFTVPVDEILNWAEGFSTLESLQGFASMPPVVKAFVLQEVFAAQFERFKQLFIDIFPTVEDVVVDRQKDATLSIRSPERLSFTLKERGVSNWIKAEDISSGMARTLNHLVDLVLAPAGTVLLIDEFENSLGVNCMGPLTDFILSRANDLQFIITSHHPYIINNIPKSYWKLVRRKGSTVRVTPASEIPALQGPSAQDDFIRLINSPEFEEGME